ncbi:hypothetical protein BGZ58_009081 [Dissophora ornata]|nr:hypothetical protein BGZ58_009081 [Dissophora ornata]
MNLKRLGLEITKLGLEVEDQYRHSSRPIAPTTSLYPAALLLTGATTTIPNVARRGVQQSATPSPRSRRTKGVHRDRKSAIVLFASASASAARYLQNSEEEEEEEEEEEDAQPSPYGVLASTPEQATALDFMSASDFVEQEARRRRLERYAAKRRQEAEKEEEEEQQLSDQTLM